MNGIMGPYELDVKCFMFLLGCLQVVAALIHAGTTRFDDIRRHIACYFAGVLIYFVLLAILGDFSETATGKLIFEIHFYGTAFALAGYRFGIAVVSLWRRIHPRRRTQGIGTSAV